MIIMQDSDRKRILQYFGWKMVILPDSDNKRKELVPIELYFNSWKIFSLLKLISQKLIPSTVALSIL